MIAYFNRFSIEMPEQAVKDCSHSGACDEDVERWSKQIQRPAECTMTNLQAELSEYGAWDEDELDDDKANWERIIWLAAENISDEKDRIEFEIRDRINSEKSDSHL